MGVAGIAHGNSRETHGHAAGRPVLKLPQRFDGVESPQLVQGKIQADGPGPGELQSPAIRLLDAHGHASHGHRVTQVDTPLRDRRAARELLRVPYRVLRYRLLVLIQVVSVEDVDAPWRARLIALRAAVPVDRIVGEVPVERSPALRPDSGLLCGSPRELPGRLLLH